jgi:hypothetical protein
VPEIAKETGGLSFPGFLESLGFLDGKILGDAAGVQNLVCRAQYSRRLVGFGLRDSEFVNGDL